MRDSLSARVSPTRTAQRPFAVTVSESSPGRGGGGGVSVGDDGVVLVGGAAAEVVVGDSVVVVGGNLDVVGAAGGGVVVSPCGVGAVGEGPDGDGSGQRRWGEWSCLVAGSCRSCWVPTSPGRRLRRRRRGPGRVSRSASGTCVPLAFGFSPHRRTTRLIRSYSRASARPSVGSNGGGNDDA